MKRIRQLLAWMLVVIMVMTNLQYAEAAMMLNAVGDENAGTEGTPDGVDVPEGSAGTEDGEEPKADVSGACGDNLTYEIYLDSGLLVISGEGDMWDYSGMEPDIPWSEYEDSVTGLIINEGVTSIGYSAFSGCENLIGDLVLPDSVVSIGSYAFSGCKNLGGNLVLPQNIKTIGMFAFASCTGFNGELILPDTIETIGCGAFENCSGFTGELVLSEGITQIESYTFRGCQGLNGDLVIPDKVETIGEDAFFDCIGLEGYMVDFPYGIQKIESRAFYKSTWTGTEKLSINVSYRGGSYAEIWAVLNNYSDSEVPDVSGNCGAEGSNLIWTFDYNDNALTISGTGEMADYTESDLPEWMEYCDYLYALELEEGITSIGDYAFYMCRDLGGAWDLPSTLTEIGDHAFQACYTIEGDLVIPEGVVSIGDSAFCNCHGLDYDKVYLPSSLQEIGELNFSVYMDQHVPIDTVICCEQGTYVDAWAQEKGFSIEYLNSDVNGTADGDDSAGTSDGIDDGNTDDDEDAGDDNDVEEDIIGGQCGDDITWSLKNNVLTLSGSGEMWDYKTYWYEHVEDDTWYGEYKLTTAEWSEYWDEINVLKIDERITSIGAYAFFGCTGLEWQSITLSESLTSIGNEAFSKSITIYDEEEGEIEYIVNMKCLFSCTDGSYAKTWVSTNGHVMDTDVLEGNCGAEGDNLTWSLDLSSRTLTISGEGKMNDHPITDIFTVEPVTGAPWGEYYGWAEKLVLEEGIASISDYAFYSCDRLKGDLIIPDSVTKIGQFAFSDCSGFEGKLILSKNITSIEVGTFQNCSGLSGKLEIPYGVISFEEDAFYGCSGFSGDLVIPDSVTKIGEAAFYCCRGLDGNLILSKNTEEINGFAFAYCSNLHGELNLPDSLEFIGWGAFQTCSGFTGDLIIPENVRRIQGQAFFFCTGFSGRVFIPPSVYEIGMQALSEKMTIFGLKNSCAEKYAIENNMLFCEFAYEEKIVQKPYSSLEQGIVDSGSIVELYCDTTGATIYYTLDGTEPTVASNVYVEPITILASTQMKAFAVKEGLENSDILSVRYSVSEENGEGGGNDDEETEDNPEGIVEGTCGKDDNIAWTLDLGSGELKVSGAGAIPQWFSDEFYNYIEYVKDIKIEEGITEIGEGAFWYCEGVSGQLVLPDGLKIIGNDAFSGCGITGDLIIPDSVVEIGNYAFQGCYGLNGELKISNSVTTIGDYAFENCYELKGELKLPETVTKIGDYAFSNCSKLTGELVIPEGVTTISDGVFSGCSGLQGTLRIPDTVTEIGALAFSQCSGLTGDLIIPEGVVSIGDRAFTDCSGFAFSEVTLPNSLESIEGPLPLFEIGLNNETMLVLYNCQEGSYADEWVESNGYLRTTDVIEGSCGEDDDVEWQFDVMQRTLSISGSGELINFSTANVYWVSKQITSAPWGQYWPFIEYVTIGEGITAIGENAFLGCSEIEDIELPGSLETVEKAAFKNCKSLSGELTIPAGVQSIGEEAFYACNGLTGDLTIPESVTEIGDWAFGLCSSFDGNLTLPRGLVRIGDYAFGWCTNLTGDITIPESVTEIGNGSFQMCKSLSGKATVYENTISIGQNAFNTIHTMYGKKDSYAEQYAAENQMTFIYLDGDSGTADGDDSVNWLVDTDIISEYSNVSCVSGSYDINYLLEKDSWIDNNFLQYAIIYTEDKSLAQEFFPDTISLTAEEMENSGYLVDYGRVKRLGKNNETNQYEAMLSFGGVDGMLKPNTTYYCRLAYCEWDEGSENEIYRFVTVPETVTTLEPVEETQVSINDIQYESGYTKATILFYLDNPQNEYVGNVYFSYIDSEGEEQIAWANYNDVVQDLYTVNINIWGLTEGIEGQIKTFVYTKDGVEKEVMSDIIALQPPMNFSEAEVNVYTSVGIKRFGVRVDVAPYIDGEFIYASVFYRKKGEETWIKDTRYISDHVNGILNNSEMSWGDASFYVSNLEPDTEYEYYVEITTEYSDGEVLWSSQDLVAAVRMPEAVTYEDEQFPDDVFRNYIKEKLGIAETEKITSNALNALTYLNIEAEDVPSPIKSIEGIQYLKSLSQLTLDGHDFEDASMLSELNMLSYLYLYSNELTEVPDLSQSSVCSGGSVRLRNNRIVEESFLETKLPPNARYVSAFISENVKIQRGDISYNLSGKLYTVDGKQPFAIEVSDFKGGRAYTLTVEVDGVKKKKEFPYEGDYYLNMYNYQKYTFTLDDLELETGRYTGHVTLTDNFGNVIVDIPDWQFTVDLDEEPDGDDSGTADGDDSGTADGDDSGTADGDDSGTADGDDNGTADGDDSGTADGDDTGTEDGKDEGTDDGDDSGTPDEEKPGTEDGGDAGTEDGKDEGTNDGGDTGKEDEKEDDVITDDEVLPGDIPESGIPANIWVSEIPEQTYTGKAIKPEIRVYDGDRRLKEGVDYKLSYKNNVNAQEDLTAKKVPTVVVKGIGNYAQTEQISFVIAKKNLADEDILAEDILLASKKKEQKVTPVLTYNGKKLGKKDFTVEFPDQTDGAYKNVGTYAVKVTGQGNYCGERIVNLTISDKILMSVVKVSKVKSQPYQEGNEIKPEVQVSYKGDDLTLGVDYTIAYENNKAVGTATIILTGQGEYVGAKKVTFKIIGTSIKKAVVAGIEDQVYDGTLKTQKVTVSLDGKSLTPGKDYEVSYEGNDKAGTATVIITGVGGYTGSVKKKFKITPYDIKADNEQKIDGINENYTVAYVQGGSKPQIHITFNGKTLEEGKDYTISCKDNKKVTTEKTKKLPTYTIKGKGNFKGSIPGTFTITKKLLNEKVAPVVLTVLDVGSADKPGKYISKPVVVDVNGKKLKAGTDYEKEISYTLEDGTVLDKKSTVAVGTKVKVTVTGKGNYEGELSGTYLVAEKSFSKAKIKVTAQEYTGEEVVLSKDDIKVTISGDILEYGVDYEIVEDSYANNVKRGTASVTIRGIGKYGGSKTVKFKINARDIK